MPLSDVLDGFGVESPAYVVIRFLLFTGTTMLIGAWSLLRIVLPRMDGAVTSAADVPCVDSAATSAADVRRVIERRTLRLMQWTLWALLLITVLRLGAQHAAYFGSRGWSRGTLEPLLLRSMWGTGWLLAVAAIAISASGLRQIRDGGGDGDGGTGRPSGGWALLVTGVFALSVSTAMSGHAAGADSAAVAMMFDTGHVIGAGGWMGTLALMVLVALPSMHGAPSATSPDAGHAGVAQLMAAFSPVALVYAALLAITGAVAGWRNIGTLDALFTSEYGLMLVRKLVVVALAAMIGAYNWKRVLPRLGTASGTQHLQKSTACELTAAVVVLALTAVLVATSPP